MTTRVRSDLPAVQDLASTPRRFSTIDHSSTELTGQAVQANKAIVGSNAFAHEAGIHQDGMLKDRRTYEIMRPEDVGAPQAALVLGTHSGRHAVRRRCEQIGVTLAPQELDPVYSAIIALAEREKTVDDSDLAAVVARIRGGPRPRRRPSSRPRPYFNSTPAKSGTDTRLG